MSSENILYDRQIRLWGETSQQRISKGHILVLGMNTINMEAAKNIVLAGSNILVYDNRTLRDLCYAAGDLTSEYYLLGDDFKEGVLTIGESISNSLRAMNDFVSVENVIEIDLQKIKGFHCESTSNNNNINKQNINKNKKKMIIINSVLIAFDTHLWYNKFELISLVSVFREKMIPVIVTMGFGPYAAFFVDVKDYTVKEKTGKDEWESVRIRMPPIEEIFTTDFLFLIKNPSRKRRRLCDNNNNNNLMLVWMELLTKYIHYLPTDKSEFLDIGNKTIKDLRIEALGNLVLNFENFYDQLRCGPITPASSITGGLVAQEVIKFLTFKDIPLGNFVITSVDELSSSVFNLPKEESVKKEFRYPPPDIEIVNESKEENSTENFCLD